MYRYNKKRIASFIVFSTILLTVTVGAIRTAASYLSKAETTIQPTPTPLSGQPTRHPKPQAQDFPKELLGLCQEDTDYNASFDLNQDGCIRQNDWDLFGR